VRTEALATNVPPLQAIDPAMIAVSNGSSAADRDQEIDRLLALGARRVDSGQTGAES